MSRRLMLRNKEDFEDKYQRVEYIQNTTNSFLLVPYIGPETKNIVIETKFLMPVWPSSESAVVHARNITNNYTHVECFCSTASNRVRIIETWLGQSGGSAEYWSGTANTQYTMRTQLNNISQTRLNGSAPNKTVNPGIMTTAFKQGDVRFGVFASGSGSGTVPFVGRVYYVTVSANDGVVLNLIPCYRKSDGEIGMYDTVSQTFFTNAGTGTFAKGADVN